MLGFASFDTVADFSDEQLLDLQLKADPESKCELGLTTMISMLSINIGLYFLLKKATPDNLRKALELFQSAANEGHSKSQYNLGLCYKVNLLITNPTYKLGEGVSVNYKKSAEWFAKAAETGEPNAVYQLAFCYFRGEGVIADHQRAVALFTKAADQGHAEAATNLGKNNYRIFINQFRTLLRGWRWSSTESGASAKILFDRRRERKCLRNRLVTAVAA
jgi:TPR repeat protein